MRRPLQRGGGGELVYAVALWVISETACRLVGYEKMSLSHCTQDEHVAQFGMYGRYRASERINCCKPFSLLGQFLIDTILKNAPKKITENAWK